MPAYQVKFSRDWIRGRWGFIDRMFFQMGGKVTDASRLENAWVLQFKGTATGLGNLITKNLEINPADLQTFGTIFEITELDAPHLPRAPMPRTTQIFQGKKPNIK